MKNSLDLYIKDIEKYEPLSAEEEQQWGKILVDPLSTAEQKQIAKDKIVNHSLKYVVKIARMYKTKPGYTSISMEDLISSGNMGLLMAVDRYDWQFGRFLTYADSWIKQYIQKARNEIVNVIDKPDHVIKAIVHVNNTREELEQILGRNPSSEEIVEAMDGAMSEEKIEEILVHCSQKIVSLDSAPANAKDDDLSYNEVVAGETATPLEVSLREEKSRLLRVALQRLPYINRRVLELSFGLTEEGEKTLDEIGFILCQEGICNGNGEQYTKQNISLLKNKGVDLIKKDKEIMEALSEYMRVACQK